jgi:hypothetical protein
MSTEEIRSANVYACPQCGGSVTFHSSIALTATCPYCQSITLRKDLNIELLGKQAILPPDLSPLQLGSTGLFENQAFVIRGRLKVTYEQGSWNEWFIEFTNGQTGWLAEFMGFFTISKPIKIPESITFNIAQSFNFNQQQYVINDIKKVEVTAWEGELPWIILPQESYQSIDCTALAYGRFDPQILSTRPFLNITIHENQQKAFLGRYCHFDELEFKNQRQVPGWDVDADRIENQTLTLNCIDCGGVCEIHAPGQSTSIVCTHCNSVLDISKPEIQSIHKIKNYARAYSLTIPIGKRLTLQGQLFQCIGFQNRKTETSSWQEYLLFHPRQGFRWLVNYQHHWTLVQTLPGTINKRQIERKYDFFCEEVATTNYVIGEFYWRVQSGEQTTVTDYIAPPEVLSSETTHNQQEITWSHGVYIDHQELAQALGTTLPEPIGISLNSPNTYNKTLKTSWSWMKYCFFISLIVHFGFILFKSNKSAHQQTFSVNSSNQANLQIPSLSLQKGRNVVQASTWIPSETYLGLEGYFIESDQNKKFPVRLGMTSYFHTSSECFVTAVCEVPNMPEGQYQLHLHAELGQTIKDPLTVKINIETGKIYHSNIIISWILLLIPFLFILYLRQNYESQRWN